MPDVTPEQRAELRRLHEAATPGPWEAEQEEFNRDFWQVIDVPTQCSIIDTHNDGCASDPSPDDVFFSPENARFIAAARNALPALLDAADERDALAARLAEVEELVSHCWVHSGYLDCGFDQMDTAMKALYREIVDREPD